MGNLNFQEDQNENPEQNRNQDQNQGQGQNEPEASDQKDPRDDEGFIDDPTSGSSKFLWVAIIVVVIAGIGGALYMANRAGYLKFLTKKKAALTTMTTQTPAQPQATAPQKTTPSAKPAMVPQGSFALQVAAFKTKPQADRYIASLRKKGIESYVVSSEMSGQRWFRVCTGSFGTKLKAIAAIENMKKRVGTDVWVVPAQ